MTVMVSSIVTKHGKRTAAIVLVAVLYGATRPTDPDPATRTAVARRFSFQSTLLPEVRGGALRGIRAVNPSYENFAAWISAVGAAVALNDLDGDGLPNDVCYVDVRTDHVIVAPVPGTGDRFAPFVLEPLTLLLDTATVAPMGCLPGDFDENGSIDLLVYYWGRTPIVFLSRDSARVARHLARASFVARELVIPVARWFTNAATLADLDGDGHGDLVIGNYFPDGSRVLDAHSAEPQTMQHSMSRAFNGGRTHVLRWVRAGDPSVAPSIRFDPADDALDEVMAFGWTLAVGAADLDGDLLPELYLARDFGPDRLLHNRSIRGHIRFALLEGRRDLAMPSSKVLGRDSFKGMSVDFGDVNGDGRPDICVSNIADEYALEESHFLFVSRDSASDMRRGVAPYVDRSEPLGVSRGGWGWDCRLADFDNDGALELLRGVGFIKGQTNRWPELHELAMGNDELLSNPKSWPQFLAGTDISGHERARFYARTSENEGRYVDVASDVGLSDEQVMRGIAIADVDADGRLDFAVANQWEASRFYHNDSHPVGAFIGLRLSLATPTGSRDAITATATAHTRDHRIVTAQLDGGNGHSGKRSHDLHLGLGVVGDSEVIALDLRWRDENGVPRAARLKLRPGWHALILAGDQAKERIVQ